MPEYSEQDLKYAAELREEIHREALAIVRKTHPNVTEVVDKHPVEDYFQEHWDYPGKWYTVVAIPCGYRNRKAFVDSLVRDTLSAKAPEEESSDRETLREKSNPEENHPAFSNQLDGKPEDDPFYRLLQEYPDLVVVYCLVKDVRYDGYESHRRALKAAFHRLNEAWNGEWSGEPDQATGKSISTEELLKKDCPNGKLSYRKAFLKPPHTNSYTGKDFDRVNASLFPSGTDGLEIYEWDTDWSDYFDDGHEWWGTLCLTVYDKNLDRFAVIMASATD